MAATVNISESNQAGEVVTDGITNINFGSVDQPNIVAANHPVIVGENSYSKYLRFHVANMGGSTTIKDLRNWASVYVPVTGERLREDNFTLSGAIPYATPSQAQIITATIPTADPGSANVDIGGDLAGTITVAPAYSGYFKMQTQSNVGGTTPVGPANSKVIVFQFDET